MQGYRRHQGVMARVCLSHTGGQGCDRVAEGKGEGRVVTGLQKAWVRAGV